ncbi:MAG TPA: VOC family protein [Myxococcales bacterium]|nr:VOC family protein [Myxococcales bacterium]HIK86679.1 VOC family protein [Myxococcales bacterium]
MSRIDDRAEVQSPPAGTPQIIPQIPYQDVLAAIDFLEHAFSFVERRDFRIEYPGGIHAEMQIGDGVIMLGGSGGHGAFPPTSEGNPSTLLMVYVKDVDAHHDRARAAGATIVAELADKFFGDRVYEALDREGHRWSFHQHTGRRFEFNGKDSSVRKDDDPGQDPRA